MRPTFANGSERLGVPACTVRFLAYAVVGTFTYAREMVSCTQRGDIMARHQWSFEAFVSQVGARIRILRFERGLSLPQLAAKTRYSVNRITQVELGQLILTARMLRRFARALKVRPFDLLNHDTQLDDLGYLIEEMRKNPEALRMVRRRIKRAQSALHSGGRMQVND